MKKGEESKVVPTVLVKPVEVFYQPVVSSLRSVSAYIESLEDYNHATDEGKDKRPH